MYWSSAAKPKASRADEATHVERRAITEMMHNEKMVLRVHVASLAASGDGFLYRYEEYGEATVLAYHETEGARAFPIHYLFMDARGKTARLIVRERQAS